MGKLKGYARASNIMRINITFGGEQFQFNLADELVVNENRINSEIMEQPTSYAFLTTLLTKLIREKEEAEKNLEVQFSKVYNRYKEKLNELTGRPYDKEYAHHIATANPSVVIKREIFIKAKHDVGIISSAVKSFEQRSFLIQTLSANIRKER